MMDNEFHRRYLIDCDRDERAGRLRRALAALGIYRTGAGWLYLGVPE